MKTKNKLVVRSTVIKEEAKNVMVDSYEMDFMKDNVIMLVKVDEM